MQEEDGHQTSPGAWLNIMCQTNVEQTTATLGGITGAIGHASKALDTLGDCHIGAGV